MEDKSHKNIKEAITLLLLARYHLDQYNAKMNKINHEP